jgi:hypothetical protein
MSSSVTITCPRDSRSIVWGFYCTKCGYLPLWREIEDEVFVSVNGDHDGVADSGDTTYLTPNSDRKPVGSDLVRGPSIR